MWKRPIYIALDESPTATAIELSTFLSNNPGENGKISLYRRDVSQIMLDYSQAGTINLQLDENIARCHILTPFGCVLTLLNDLCLAALPQTTLTELSAWKITSQSVNTNKGHYYERLLAAEGIIPSSTIYEVLSAKFCRTLLPVPVAVGKEFLYTAEIANLDWENISDTDFRVHCVRDAATSKGKRTIDVVIPVMDVALGKIVPVFFDVKDVANECTNWHHADNAFFHPSLQNVTYPHYLVFFCKNIFTTKTPEGRKVSTGKKSALECKSDVVDCLEEKRNYCIIEGHELL